MLGRGTYKTRGGYTAHVTERGNFYWSGVIEGAGAGGDPGSGLWRDDGRDYYGYDVFDILLSPPSPHTSRRKGWRWCSIEFLLFVQGWGGLCG